MKLPLPKFLQPGSFTILVVLPRRLIRADFGGNPLSLIQLWHCDAPPGGESLSVLADAAFALGPNRKTVVYLLAASCWTGVVPLSSARASTLSTAELEQALSFETLANVSPFDSLLSAIPLGRRGTAGEQQFWVTQSSKAEIASLEETLRRRGARLAGLAHPGGLPQPLHVPANADATAGGRGRPPPQQDDAVWMRTELWGDFAVCLYHGKEGGLQLHVFEAASSYDDAISDAEAWFTAHGMSGVGELLVAPGIPVDEAAVVLDDLNEETRLAAWMTAWALEIADQALRVPFLRPPPRPMSIKRRITVASAWAGAALLLCAAHGALQQHDETKLQKELDLAQTSAKQLDAAKSRARTSEEALTNARQHWQADRRLLGDWEFVMRQERRRHAVLLHAIAETATAECVLLGLTESAGEVRLSMLAARPELPGFTEKLASAMAPLDWRVGLPNRQARNLSPNGGPWQLDWVIQAIDVTNRTDRLTGGAP